MLRSVAKLRRSVALAFLSLAMVVGVVSPLITSPIPQASAAGNDDFVTVWDTTKGGAVAKRITIPVNSTYYYYKYSVDWGDGQISTNLSGNANHTYADDGVYTVRISGTFPHIYFNSTNLTTGTCVRLMEIKQWGTISWRSMEKSFRGCVNMQMTATDSPDLRRVTNMDYMFDNAKVMTGNTSMNNWNTGNVTRMFATFIRAAAFNAPIGNWDVSKVTTMNGMFSGAAAFNQDISGWNTSKNTDLTETFNEAAAFNQPIGSWDISKVTSLQATFQKASAFNQPLNTWNTSSVTSLNSTFAYASAFNQPLNLWNTSNVTSMGLAFINANAFNQPLGSWDIRKVTGMQSFLFGTGLSNANYDATLIAWAEQAATGLMVNKTKFWGGSSKACSTAANAARTTLQAFFGEWRDGGSSCTLNSISLSNDTVVEGATTVGLLSSVATDPSVLVFSLANEVGKEGNDDNSKFTITANDELLFKVVPDYEAPNDQGDIAGNNTYSVRVKVAIPPPVETDPEISYEQVFLIRVTDKDEAAPTATIIAPTKTNNFEIIDTTLRFTDDFEINNDDVDLSGSTAGFSDLSCVQTSHREVNCTVKIISSGSLHAKITDIVGNTAQVVETGYAVTNTISSSINENLAVPTTLAKLSTISTIPSAFKTDVAYSKTCTTPGAQDSYFTMSGDLLRLSTSPDYETITSLTTCIRITNDIGETYDQTFTFAVNNLYRLSYDGNGSTGGTVPVASESYAPASTATVSANTGSLTRASYSFAGWNTKADGTGTSYAPSDSLTINSDTTLYAKWTNSSYKVTYNANGGTGTTAETTGDYNTATTLANNNFSRTGYSFTKWNTQADGNGTDYAAGASYTFPANDLTLYAQWSINQYTLSFDTQGGSAVTAQTVDYNATTTKPADPTRTGHSFAGWYKESTLTNIWNFTLDTMPASDTTLYAKWTNSSYKVTYNANGGTGTTAETTGDYNTATTLANNNFSRTGYSFTKWNTQADGNGTDYAAGASYTFPANDLTLYAQWSDTQPPTAPAAAPDLQSASDTGISNSDNITNDTTPTFDLVCKEVGGQVTLYMNGTARGTASCTSAGTVTVTVSPALADGSYIFTYTETDSTGNESNQSPELIVTISTAKPVVSIPSTLTNTASPAITGTINDSTTDIIITVGGEEYTAHNNGSGTCSLAAGTILPALTDGTYSVSVVATDTAGNKIEQDFEDILTIDTVKPTVTINQGASQPDPTNIDTAVFDIKFSETIDPTSFTVSDIALTGTTTATVTSLTTTDNKNYIATITGMTNGDTVKLTLGADKVTDPAGNANLASTSTDNSVHFMTNRPTVVATRADGQKEHTNLDQAIFTIKFSKEIKDGEFAASDITINGTSGSISEFTKVSATEYAVTITGMTDGDSASISVPENVVTDLVGNQNMASANSPTVHYDTTRPTVTINQQATQPDPTNLNSAKFTIIFSEKLATDLTKEMLSLTGTSTGSVSNLIKVSDTEYTAEVTGMTSGDTVKLVLDTDKIKDLAGNNNTASISTDNIVAYDSTAPTATINPVAPSTKTQPGLSGAVDDHTVTITVKVNSKEYPATNNGDGSWSLPAGTIGVLPAGQTTVKVSFKDNAGNITQKQTTITVYPTHLSLTNVNDNQSTSDIVNNSKITVTAGTCQAGVMTAYSLSGNSVTAPEQRVIIIGGITYKLNCEELGGDATVDITLGSYYPDLSILRIYKQENGNLVDITGSVNLRNEAGTTKLTIKTVDGATYDDDNTENREILDPIYIGIYNPKQPDVLSRTGDNQTMMLVIGLVMTTLPALYIKRRVVRVNS